MNFLRCTASLRLKLDLRSGRGEGICVERHFADIGKMNFRKNFPMDRPIACALFRKRSATAGARHRRRIKGLHSND